MAFDLKMVAISHSPKASRTNHARPGIRPKHLAKENKRFVFGQVRKGACAADFEKSISCLEQAGLISKTRRISKPGIPLSAYAFVDIGLLGAMCGLDPASILESNRVFTEFKGSLTEQYVCQELIASRSLAPHYWSAENSSGEIDFIAQIDGTVYPIEENLRAKSLRAFKSSYPQTECVRFSMSGYREQDWMKNVPLYAISSTKLWG